MNVESAELKAVTDPTPNEALSSPDTLDEDMHPNVIENICASAKKAESLANEITEIGTRLHDLFKSEEEGSQERDKVLRFLNSFAECPDHDSSKQDHVESSVACVLESTTSAVDMLNKRCKILISSQRGTEEKIRKKTIDLERSSKRLESLKHTRPAYMDEYEQLEEELKVEYEAYVVRLRNVDYLEEELSSFKQAETEKKERAERFVKRMQNKFREEELRTLDRGSDLEREVSPINPMRDCAHNEAARIGDSSIMSTHEEHSDSFSRSSASSSENGLSSSETSSLLESGVGESDGESDYDF